MFTFAKGTDSKLKSSSTVLVTCTLLGGMLLSASFGGCGSSSSSGGAGGKAGSQGNGGRGTDAGTAGGAGTATGGTTGGTDAGATGGTTPGTDGAVAAGALGKACTSAAECGSGLICLLPTDKKIFGTGGPAGGYCTLPCTAENQGVCRQGGGTCVNLAASSSDPPQPYCMQNCIYGEAGTATKCQLRADVACTRFTSSVDGGANADICIPVCSSDSQCPTGRKCDENLSVCVDVPSAGTALGSHCTVDTTGTLPDTCAGFCLPLGNAAGGIAASFCSRRCVLGVLEGCNWAEKAMSLAAGGAHGICVLAEAGAGPGDLGFCSQECDTAADCSNKTDPGVTCDTTTLDAALMSHGVCSW